MTVQENRRWRARHAIAGLILFAISFGYVEAAVVVYLRTLYEPLRRPHASDGAEGELFPLITQDRLRTQPPAISRLLPAEVGREAATLLMLAGAAMAAAAERRLWLPAFAIAFGVWDLFFYVFLKVLTGWPRSLLTWDVLFLIPVPWASPVLAPVLVSLTLIVCGVVAFQRPVHWRGVHSAGLGLAAGLILFSFMADYRNLMAGGMPAPFGWWVFALGEAVWVAAFAHACRKRSNSPGALKR